MKDTHAAARRRRLQRLAATITCTACLVAALVLILTPGFASVIPAAMLIGGAVGAWLWLALLNRVEEG